MNPIVLNEEEVIIAETYKYLSTVIYNKMKGSENIAKMAKKANQMVYFVWKLRNVGVNRKILGISTNQQLNQSCPFVCDVGVSTVNHMLERN